MHFSAFWIGDLDAIFQTLTACRQSDSFQTRSCLRSEHCGARVVLNFLRHVAFKNHVAYVAITMSLLTLPTVTTNY